ncbi:MAG: hypothetical protein LBL04_09065 [Bacteroidales bacterium]|jgi:hypothetical protein|nr:hypothetical protein [Bacteroidales bacterium]
MNRFIKASIIILICGTGFVSAQKGNEALPRFAVISDTHFEYTNWGEGAKVKVPRKDAWRKF